jgi:hypothetical protein
LLHQLRHYSVAKAYNQHFARYDIERKIELQEYLAHGTQAQGSKKH